MFLFALKRSRSDSSMALYDNVMTLLAAAPTRQASRTRGARPTARASSLVRTQASACYNLPANQPTIMGSGVKWGERVGIKGEGRGGGYTTFENVLTESAKI